jgi:DNA repair exonuclease SbcCD nuclease subunit
MRFLHTADWQIGMKAADKVRRAQLDRIRRIN